MTGPSIVAAALLIVCERYGGHHRTVDVVSAIDGKYPETPYLGVGTPIYPQPLVLAACEGGWLDLVHDADTRSLTLAPTEQGSSWLSHRRLRRGVHA